MRVESEITVHRGEEDEERTDERRLKERERERELGEERRQVTARMSEGREGGRARRRGEQRFAGNVTLNEAHISRLPLCFANSDFQKTDGPIFSPSRRARKRQSLIRRAGGVRSVLQ